VSPAPVTALQVDALAELALGCIHREYPYHLVHLMRDDGDARPPRELTPAFYNTFDWHSAVHGHWCLVRLLRRHGDARFAARAEAALETGLTTPRLAREAAYVEAPGREGFERPYGLAWLLQLAAELRGWQDPRAERWLAALSPLERIAAERLASWLPKLRWPVRSGEHSQTAFALGLAHDWAVGAGDPRFTALARSRALDWFAADADAPIAWEPSGQDFLSPVLGEADLMRRVVPASDFERWLARFLPDLESPAAMRWLTPVTPSDRADGKLSHLDGLNLSRAWMLEGIAAALTGAGNRRRAAILAAAAARHRHAGLAGTTGEYYAGAHWLGSFATYLVTGRGLGTA
jgi:DUF2891 family protein